ncbi:uncharacterized protein LOC107271547 isoform X2 [Cephus cinctus]|uniref:Uncharacterized protein LOC107271547 isoform X2 n=1 Tax=Cephus cinctus TaxID=211228 RepID=A0AAJ7FQG7_CEPCN|nr:uncharacterized protein LOC107271547 isoform X2 [Cephus cinctus]
MVSPTAKLIGLRSHHEQILYNAIIVTEMGMDLRDRAQAGEKYVCYLRSLAVRASRAISSMHNSAKTFIMLSQRFVKNAIRHLNSVQPNDQSIQSLRQEYERLLVVLEKELLDIDDLENVDVSLNNDLNTVNLTAINERLRNLETRQKFTEQNFSLPHSSSARSFKSEVDEKYPENWSRDSLIDLSSVVNLPPVPEDIFTSFSKPVRSSSLSSLKSIRKVKLYLQRAANSEDEER